MLHLDERHAGAQSLKLIREVLDVLEVLSDDLLICLLEALDVCLEVVVCLAEVFDLLSGDGDLLVVCLVVVLPGGGGDLLEVWRWRAEARRWWRRRWRRVIGLGAMLAPCMLHQRAVRSYRVVAAGAAATAVQDHLAALGLKVAILRACAPEPVVVISRANVHGAPPAPAAMNLHCDGSKNAKATQARCQGRGGESPKLSLGHKQTFFSC